MNVPGAAERFALLLRLKLRLSLRAVTGSKGRVLAYALAFPLLLVWAGLFASWTWYCATNYPELTGRFTHFVFLLVLTMQVVLGLMSLTSAEFFDVSRIMHLPIGPRDVFAAMSVGSLMAPFAIIYLAPGVGLSLALGGGVMTISARIGVCLLLMFTGNVLALGLDLLFMTLMTRRRLRELSSLVVGLLVPVGYLFFRTMTWQDPTGRNLYGFIAADPAAGLGWLPSAWISELFLARWSADRLAVMALGLAVFLLAVLWLGARALQAAFHGQVPAPKARQITAGDSARRSWLPGDLSAMTRLVRRLAWREPQIKTIYLQQTVFLTAPVFFMQFGGSEQPEAARYALIGLLPFTVAVSHLVFVQSLFGLDGRGAVQLLLSPVSRRRMLFARGITWGAFFLAADLVICALVLGVFGSLRGQPLGYFVLLPEIYVAVIIFDLVLLALGTITSVLWPLRLATSGRRAIQGRSADSRGCTAQIVRMLLFLPGCLVAALLAALALAPGLVPQYVPHSLIWVSVPLMILVALGIYIATVCIMAPVLVKREDRLLAALTDTGG